MKYYACLLFLFFTFFSIYSFYGQDKKIDSLKAIIVKSNLTTEKVNSYILWSDLLVNINNTESEYEIYTAKDGGEGLKWLLNTFQTLL